ncbi:MAG: hypothetical protein ABI883_07240 [Chthoniobacterales bacterium]
MPSDAGRPSDLGLHREITVRVGQCLADRSGTREREKVSRRANDLGPPHLELVDAGRKRHGVEFAFPIGETFEGGEPTLLHQDLHVRRRITGKCRRRAEEKSG